MGLETLPSACYILSDESSIPFYSTSNGYKNGRKTPSTPAGGQCCCPGSNTTTGQVRTTDKVLEEIHYRAPVGRNMPSKTSLPTWTSCRACARKKSEFWPNSTNRSNLFYLSRTTRTISPLGIHRIPPPLATLQIKRRFRSRWLL